MRVSMLCRVQLVMPAHGPRRQRERCLAQSQLSCGFICARRSEPADYVVISEITGVDRWETQISEQVQRLADDLAHLVSARRMLVVERVL